MPTPVKAARQCLTQEAAAVLDEALEVARRRGHAQTTSFHMVSSLLSLPNSSLREACTRTRNNAYSTRVQFKALELSLGVSLDRLPSSQATRVEEPPVSNSLMAAIKRSQANQRRQPENFTFYQQQQQQYSSCSSVPVVKVELQNLILSILDDPLVSRIFGEAGFRSCDIKMATLMPGKSFHPSRLFGNTSRYKRPSPPLFLCNLTSSDTLTRFGGKAFSFPFMSCFSGDENSTRIGEVMLRDKKRSPLLLGVSACDALTNFLESVQRKIKCILPEELSGLSVVCVKDEILMYLNGDCDEGSLKLRFEEVEKMLENVTGAGVVMNFGDLKAWAGDGVSIDCLRYLVSKLASLVEVYSGKVWLIGAAATYEVYVKMLNKFPTIEEDWDLEVLPITSLQFSAGGSYPRSSLMESFVPFGGFFSMPVETKSLLSNGCQNVVRCHLCNEKYEQEVGALSDGGLCASVAQQYQSTLPSWLQTAEPGSLNGSSSLKGKDDKLLLNAKIMGLQKKWDSICQKHHFGQTFSKQYTHQLSYQFPHVLGFEVAKDGKEKASNNVSNNSNESSNDQENKNASSSLSNDLGQSSLLIGRGSTDVLTKANNLSLLSKTGETVSESKGEPGGLKSHHFDSLSASINDGHTSPTSVTSVTTDLGLGINRASASREVDKSVDQSHVDTFSRCISKCSPKSSPLSYRDNQMNVKDPKLLYKALVETVGRQEEAISSVVEAMTQCRTKTSDLHGDSQRNTWINLRGPDRLGKKKLGLALAEILYGSRESLIYADLSFPDKITDADTLFNSQVTYKYELTMRGTVLDYLVEKLNRRPSVIFLENIDKADLVVQNGLLQAVKTGRFTDLCGREVNVSNCIFLGTTRFLEGGQSKSSGEDSAKYTEEDTLSAKSSSIQIVIGFDLNDDPMSERRGPSDLFLMNKRKLVGRSRSADQCGSLEVTKRAFKASKSYLDLNLPAEGSELCNGESDSDSSSDNPKSWLEDFEAQIDETVVFKPLDLDTLAEMLFEDMSECLNNVVGSECSIEIEPNIMLQLLSAAYLYGNKKVEDWIQHVVIQGFVEAMGRYSLDAHSIVKLVTYEGSGSVEQPDGILPARIIIK